MRTVAVVLAGGSGTRLGGTEPKQLALLGGRTLMEHCVAAFDQAPGVAEVLVVTPQPLVARAGQLLGGRYPKVSRIIAGGADRPGSASRAIAALSAGGHGQDRECNVLLHDAARPLIDQRIIADCVAALQAWQAVGVVVPASDTIVGVTGGTMRAMPSRDTLGHCQTPQGFRLSVISEAYRRAAADPDAAPATDDCGVVLNYLPDIPVHVVPGSRRNIKITYPDDLKAAQLLI